MSAAGCKIALLPKLLPVFDEVGQYSRDTGDWLSIAEKAQHVNEVCVKDRGMGGLEEVGELRGSAKTSSRVLTSPCRIHQETSDPTV